MKAISVPFRLLVEFLRSPWAGAAALPAGLALIVAELWLLTLGWDMLLLVIPLLALTSLGLFVIGQALWEDSLPWRQQRWHRRGDPL